MKKIIFIGTIFCFSAIVSCKKNSIKENSKIVANLRENHSNESTVYLPETEEEQQLVNKIKIAKELIKKIYEDKEAIKEVMAFCVARVYSEENAFLKDLLNSTMSTAYNAKQLEKYLPKIQKGIFEQRFRNALKDYYIVNNSDPVFSFADFAESDITIYFPYSKLFINELADLDNYDSGDISLIAADRDADAQMGERPVSNISNQTVYEGVIINDEYASANLTNIIGVNNKDKTIYYITLDDGSTIETGINPTGIPTLSARDNDYTLPGRRVYLGYARCTKQYDKFISFTGNGGGSEMRFCRVSGYLKIASNGSISDFEDQVNVQFDRKQIRDEDFLRIYSVWDANWKDDNLEQVYTIWEEDNKGQITFNGSLSTTVTATVGSTTITRTGSIGFNFTRQSQDAIVRQLKWSRADYLADALNDQGCLFLDNYWGEDWPKYDCSSDVTWTFPVKTF